MKDTVVSSNTTPNFRCIYNIYLHTFFENPLRHLCGWMANVDSFLMRLIVPACLFYILSLNPTIFQRFGPFNYFIFLYQVLILPEVSARFLRRKDRKHLRRRCESTRVCYSWTPRSETHISHSSPQEFVRKTSSTSHLSSLIGSTTYTHWKTGEVLHLMSLWGTFCLPCLDIY